MDDAIEQGARAAARRLTTSARPELVDDVEVALHTRQGARDPEQYSDPAAIGGLIVSIATLAWTIYNDIRSRSTTAPSADAVCRRVRQQLDQADTPARFLGPAEGDRLIDVTVEETLNTAQNSNPEAQ